MFRTDALVVFRAKKPLALKMTKASDWNVGKSCCPLSWYLANPLVPSFLRITVFIIHLLSHMSTCDNYYKNPPQVCTMCLPFKDYTTDLVFGFIQVHNRTVRITPNKAVCDTSLNMNHPCKVSCKLNNNVIAVEQSHCVPPPSWLGPFLSTALPSPPLKGLGEISRGRAVLLFTLLWTKVPSYLHTGKCI